MLHGLVVDGMRQVMKRMGGKNFLAYSSPFKTIFILMRLCILTCMLVTSTAMAADYTGSYAGSYGGDDSGTWEANILPDSTVAASGTSVMFWDATGSGNVSPDGTITMNLYGAAFVGTINLTTNRIDGNWSLTSPWGNTFTGTFGGTKLLTTVTLTISKNGTGIGTVSSIPSGISCGTTCNANFNSGTSVTLTATPASGSSFTGWGGACANTSGTCTVSMTAAKYVTANFAAAPGAPTIGIATPANASASITFAAPALTGGSAITRYDATCNSGNFTNFSSTATPITVSGLTNGAIYTCSVTATNAAGTSAASGTVSVTPRTVPGMPAGVSATPGNLQATVSFIAPTNTGGSAITGYTVTSIPAGGGDTNAGSTALTHTITGLSNGISYTFKVTASNSAGAGAASAASNAVIPAAPATVPGAPTIGTATPANTSASIAFAAPASTGGSAITRYDATCNPGNFTGSSSAATPITVSGLTNGTPYTCSVTATNAIGPSAASGTVSVTPRTVPSLPTGVSATPGNLQASISFNLPSSNGGSPITGYSVTSNPGGKTNSGLTSPIIVTGLTNGNSYTFTVTASNAAGSATSTASSAVIPLSPPSLSGSSAAPKYSTASTLSGAGSLAPSSNNPSFHGDPVNTATGSHVLERSLLTVNGVRPITLTVRYDSVLLLNGPLGYGWRHNFETSLEVLSGGSVTLHWDANLKNTFTNDGANNFSSADVAIKFDRLIKNNDNSYTLTRKDGTVYQFNSSGKLTQLKSRVGQPLNLAYDASNRLATITEPVSGAALTFTYLTNGLVDHVIGMNRQVSFTYDATGNLLAITDPNNKTTAFTYNAQGRVLTGVDAEGNTIFTNTYDSSGRVNTQDDALTSTAVLTRFSYDEITQPGKIITTVTDRTSAQKVLTHDNNYNLVSIKDELNNTSSYTYDTNGNRLTSTDPNANVTTYTYDARGNILTITDPKNRVTTMTYDSADNLLTATNNAGKRATYTYDTSNRVLTAKDALNRTTAYSYNANGQLASVTDPKGGVTTYTYAAGRVQSIGNPVGDTTLYTYDSAGRVLTLTNAAGKVTTLAYDGADNLLSVTDPLGNRVSYTYDSRHNRLTLTTPKGNITTYAYNGNGKLKSVKNALNQVTTLAYDAEDRLASVTDARGNTSAIAYDAAGRPITSTDALNNAVATAYDTVGNVVSVKDANNITVQTATFDPKSYQLLTVKDALLNTTTFSYDTLDRVSGVLDPLNRNRQYSYDDLNRLTATIDPKSGSASQSFDANGNRIAQADPNNNQTTFAYNVANRLTGITSASGGVQTIAYANGRVSGTSNARGQSAVYTYFDDGRLMSVSDAAGTISYTYDANGNPLTISEGGKTLSYAYDALNRVTQYTDGDGNALGYTYDAVGNLATLTYPGTKVVTYAYDAVNRLTTVTDWAARVTRYSYDKNGRLVSTVRPDGSIESRTYNAAGQLLQFKDTKADGTTPINSYDFTYSAAGNVTSESSLAPVPSQTPATVSMTYGADNRLTSHNGSAVTYDADGNMVSGPLAGSMSAMVFDARNRLLSAAGTSYAYDANNIRIGVTAAGQTAKYVVNPLAALSQVLMEKDAAGAVKAYYVYGLGLLGRQDASDNSYKTYHFDRRGSTVALTNITGVVTDTYSYLAYGEQLAHTGTTAQPFRYNGRDGVMTDANGLYNMRARYYNPDIERFVNMDTLMGGIGDGQTLNRFAYVGGNPVNRIDANGNFAISDIGGWSYDKLSDVGAYLITYGDDINNPISGIINDTMVQPGMEFGDSAENVWTDPSDHRAWTGLALKAASVGISVTPVGIYTNIAKGGTKGTVHMGLNVAEKNGFISSRTAKEAKKYGDAGIDIASVVGSPSPSTFIEKLDTANTLISAGKQLSGPLTSDAVVPIAPKANASLGKQKRASCWK